MTKGTRIAILSSTLAAFSVSIYLIITTTDHTTRSAHAAETTQSFHIIERDGTSYTKQHVLHDDERHVTCWLVETTTLGGLTMYCMRDIDLQDGLPKE